jgi:hypothetical protein
MMFEKPYCQEGIQTKFGELKTCPHCGGGDDDLEFGLDDVSIAWWDSANRGLKYGFVKCSCGAMVLASDDKDAFDAWNARKDNVFTNNFGLSNMTWDEAVKEIEDMMIRNDLFNPITQEAVNVLKNGTIFFNRKVSESFKHKPMDNVSDLEIDYSCGWKSGKPWIVELLMGAAGCAFCKSGEHIHGFHIEDNILYREIEKNKTDSIVIDFCPSCGRSLKGE